MSTPTIHNTIVRPGNDEPPTAAAVQIELVGEHGRRVAGVITATQVAIEGAFTPEIDADGYWEFTLPAANSEITPAGTRYKATEIVDGRETVTIFEGPDDDDDHWLFDPDIESEPPGALPGGPLAAHIADTVDAHDASAVSYAGTTGLSATTVEAAIDELAGETRPFVRASTHGFAAAATGLVNRAALQAAATAAIAAGVDLFIDVSSATVEVDAVNTAITLPTALRVFGAGSGKTIITVTPATPTFDHNLFLCTATSGVYRFEGMTVHGPTTYAAPHSDTSIGIKWWTGLSGAIYLDDYVSDGYGWDSACYVSGKVDMHTDTVDVSHNEKGFAHFESTNTASVRCTMKRTRVHDLVKSTSVGIYIHPHIALDVDSDCVFENIGRWGIYQNGSPSMANPHTKISGRFVDSGVAHTTSVGYAEIVDFVNEGAGFNASSSIMVGKDATINGHFKGATLPITALSLGAQEIVVAATGEGLTGNLINTSGARWRVSGFYNLDGGRVINQTLTPDVEVDGVTVSGTTSQAFNIGGGTSRLRNITSFLTGTGKVFNFTGGTAHEVSGFRNRGTSTGVVLDATSLAAGALTGSDNDFTGATAGSVTAATNQQRMVRRPGLAPTSIASAASVALGTSGTAETNSHDTFLVTGNTTINNLTGTGMFVGPVRLVAAAGSAWALGSSGNIVAAPGPRPVNSVVVLMWEPTAAKWLEVGSEPTEVIGIAVGDETTAITTTGTKTTFRMPFAMNLTAVRASLTTASSSGVPTFDINEGGASILSTKLTIDAGEKTSVTAATAAVISDATLADDAEITIDVDVTGTGATGPKIWLIGTRL